MDSDAATSLVAEVLRKAIMSEGLNYLRSPGGRYWVGLLGYDPKVFWGIAHKTKGKLTPEYIPWACRHGACPPTECLRLMA